MNPRLLSTPLLAAGFSVVENVLYISAFGLKLRPAGSRGLLSARLLQRFRYLGRFKFSDHAFRRLVSGWGLPTAFTTLSSSPNLFPLSVVILVCPITFSAPDGDPASAITC